MGVLLRELADDYRVNPDPVSGSRAYRECHTRQCDWDCHGHSRSCRLNRILIWFERLHGMPRGKKKSTGPQFNTEFVRCELTSDDKKRFTQFMAKPPIPLDDLVVEVLQSNHKISFSYSDHNSSFICSVTGKPDDCDNAGKCYTSHAKDYATALWVALFKFHIIWERGVWESSGDEADFG